MTLMRTCTTSLYLGNACTDIDVTIREGDVFSVVKSRC